MPTPPSADEWDALDGLARSLTASGWYRVVRRFRRRERYDSPTPANVKFGLYVDVESTGTAIDSDQIIELAAVRFEFDSRGCIYGVSDAVSFLEDPGVAIPPNITHLTGVDDDMVRGQRIDDEVIDALLDDTALVIAHNAAFDRPMLERRLPRFTQAHWACSMQEIPWEEFGSRGRKLDYLLYQTCAEFHDGHSAADDCLAGIHLLAQCDPAGRSALCYLLDSARQPTLRVWAIDAPFDRKDDLKARKYRWNDGSDGRPKAWNRDLLPTELENERAWLLENVYRGKADSLRIDRLTAKERYSRRI